MDPLENEDSHKISNQTHPKLSNPSKSRINIITIPGNTNAKVRKKYITLDSTKNAQSKLLKPEIKLRKFREVDKHQENLATILLYSNATPLKRKEKGGNGYACCFCSMMFSNAGALKTHTLTAHDDKCKSKYMKHENLSKFLVKLDITNLCCNICDSKLNNLDNLVLHLTMKHNKRFHEGLKNYILPFKFETDEFECVICKNKFNFFKLLIEHMKTHYRNYFCETCGEGFTTKGTCLNHSYRHKKGEFKCSYCDKVFDARVKQKEHERSVHISMNRRYKCAYCSEKFPNSTKKYNHHVHVHGVKPLVRMCNACDMTFSNQRALTIHTRSYHLMERKLKK